VDRGGPLILEAAETVLPEFGSGHVWHPESWRSVRHPGSRPRRCRRLPGGVIALFESLLQKRGSRCMISCIEPGLTGPPEPPHDWHGTTSSDPRLNMRLCDG